MATSRPEARPEEHEEDIGGQAPAWDGPAAASAAQRRHHRPQVLFTDAFLGAQPLRLLIRHRLVLRQETLPSAWERAHASFRRRSLKHRLPLRAVRPGPGGWPARSDASRRCRCPRRRAKTWTSAGAPRGAAPPSGRVARIAIAAADPSPRERLCGLGEGVVVGLGRCAANGGAPKEETSALLRLCLPLGAPPRLLARRGPHAEPSLGHKAQSAQQALPMAIGVVSQRRSARSGAVSISASSQAETMAARSTPDESSAAIASLCQGSPRSAVPV